jgi:surface polysaccharide O-acyltransferase-like enzyme
MGAGLVNLVSQDTDYHEWFLFLLRLLELIYAFAK